MTKIKFELPIFSPLAHGPLRIEKFTVPVQFSLIAGKHLFTSNPFEIGSFYHFKVFAHITIPYSYDKKKHYITIAGLDDKSDKQLTIHTSLEQNPKTIDTRSFNNKGITLASHNIWTNFIENTPEVKQFNQTAIKQAIDALVSQLLGAGIEGVIKTGVAPRVTPDNYQDYKLIFKPQKADVYQPTLEDILEVQGIVESTVEGTVTWNLNDNFANVEDTTDDPKPKDPNKKDAYYKSWLTLWADQCNSRNNPTECSSNGVLDGNAFTCNTPLCGGHVIKAKKSRKVAKGGTVYIFPICNAHNKSTVTGAMTLMANTEGVELNYQEKPTKAQI